MKRKVKCKGVVQAFAVSDLRGRERERREKVEQARLETEAILKQQQAEVDKRKELMEKKDVERELIKVAICLRAN